MRSESEKSPDQRPFEDMRESLQKLRDEDLDAVPASSMDQDMVELRQHINGCEAEFQRRLRRFDSGQGYAASGGFSSKPWLRWQCNLSPAAASDRVEVSRLIASLPETAKAFAEGEISYQHAAMIARAAEKLGDKMESNAESILVAAAKEMDPARLRVVTVQLRHYMDPDAVLEDANEAHDLRCLWLSQTLDGAFYLNGRLDSEGGATLQTALNAVSGPPASDDNRSPRQRRADALVELARRLLDGGQLPAVGGQKPHLVVTVDVATLNKLPGSPAAELEWAQPIPAETARRLACDCSITPVFRGVESHQVEAGHTGRAIPAPMKRALVARDKGCRFPGCDRPPAWTDGHHLEHWADGNPTLPWNLVLLCRRHHYRVHEEGWRLGWGTSGELIAQPP